MRGRTYVVLLWTDLKVTRHGLHAVFSQFFFVCHPLYSLKKSLEHGQLCVLGCFASSRITSRRYPNRDVFATLWFARYPLEL